MLPEGWRQGKRGGVRIGYAYLEVHRAVLLVIAYAKKERRDLSAGERRVVKELIARIEREFARRQVR